MTNKELNEFLVSFGAENVDNLNTKQKLKLIKNLIAQIDVEIDYNDLLNTKDKIETSKYVNNLRQLQTDKCKTIGYMYELKTIYKEEKKAKRKQLIRGIINGQR